MKNEDKEFFILLAWLKKQREKDDKHRQYRAYKAKEEDVIYVNMITETVKKWHQIRSQDKIMLCNFARWKNDGRNFTPPQRSVITQIYYKIKYS